MGIESEPELLWVFFADSDRALTAPMVRAALEAEGCAVAGEGPWTVRWEEDGPAVRVSLERGPQWAECARRAVLDGRGPPRFTRFAATCDACVVVEIDDLDALLDDANTIIVIQLALEAATHGLVVRSWNDILQLGGETHDPEKGR